MTSPHASIIGRVAKHKSVAIEQLQRVPIVQVVCEKAGISRATYYRWRNEDVDFAQKTDEAITTGRGFINDLAESQLLKAIQSEDLTAIIFWLKHNHPQYNNRVEISAEVVNKSQDLTPEQQEMIRRAVQMATPLNNNLSEGEI